MARDQPDSAASDTERVRPAAAQGPVSHAIFRIARLHRALAQRLLRQVGLHPGQETLMMHLWDSGPQRQVDLTRALNSDPATMTRTIGRLEKAGYVRRTPSAMDGRAMIIESTAAGEALRDQVEQIWRRLEALTTAGLDRDQQTTILDTLLQLESQLMTVELD